MNQIQQAPPPPPEKRFWGFWATFGLGAGVLAAFVIVQVVVVAIAGAFAVIPELRQAGSSPDLTQLYNQIMDALNQKLGLLQSIATILSGIVGTGLIILFIKVRRRADIQEYLDLYGLNLKSVLVSLGTAIGLVAAFSFLTYLVGSTSEEGIVNDLYSTAVWPPLFWISVVVFAPLFEEALFRGFLFAGFRQSPLGVWWTIILTSLGWALMHGLQYSFFNIAWIFVLGVVIGFVRVKTKSIWSAFIMHATVNFIATLSLAMNWNF